MSITQILVPDERTTLYGLTDDIQTYLESIESIPELVAAGQMTQEEGDQALAETEQQLASAIEQLPAKVDSFAGYIQRCAVEEQFLKERAAAIRAMAGMWAARAERLKRYARSVIEALPLDGKGKWQKLRGKESTISLRSGRTSVEIESLDAVPRSFREITVKMPEETWVHMRAWYEMNFDEPEQAQPDLQRVQVIALEAPRTPIKAAIEAGHEVPGARLSLGEPSVIVQ